MHEYGAYHVSQGWQGHLLLLSLLLLLLLCHQVYKSRRLKTKILLWLEVWVFVIEAERFENENRVEVKLLLPLQRRLCFHCCLFVCLSVVCLFFRLLATLCKNFRIDWHEIFRVGCQWANEQMIKFWWRSGSQIEIRIRITTLVRHVLVEVCAVLLVVIVIGWCCVVKVTAASRRVLLLLHFAGLLVPTLLVINLVYATLLLFIPIMGRTGTASYPDLFIGCLTVSTVVVLSTWQVTVNGLWLFVLW